MITPAQFTHLTEQYPEFITQKQMCKICSICPKTAYNITRRGEITFSREVDHRGSHNKIRLTDVIKYLSVLSFRCSPDTDYLKKLRLFFAGQLKKEPDILATADVVRITGYSKSAVTGWVRNGRLQTLGGCYKKFWIPKVYLLDFLIGDHFRLITRKSKKHIAYMQNFEYWVGVYRSEEDETNES